MRNAWSLLMGPRDRSGPPMAVPFRCGSRRCPRCCVSVAAEDYRRIEAAATSRPEWLYLVLTFDPSRHASRGVAFKESYRMWRKKLRRRIERAYGAIEYVQTWEQTRAGWPHVNVLLRSDRLLQHVHELGTKRQPVKPKNGGRVERYATTCPKWRRWLSEHAIGSGFGFRVWVEHVGESSAMAAYLAKVVGEFVRGELKHGDQRPLAAPRGFRALRASWKLLPPRERSSGLWIGGMARRAPGAFLDTHTGECAPTWADVDALIAERAMRVAERVEARELASARAMPTMAGIEAAALAWSQRVWHGPAVVPPRTAPRRRRQRRMVKPMALPSKNPLKR